jgi:uncharacterized membrane protein (DUF106 family)
MLRRLPMALKTLPLRKEVRVELQSIIDVVVGTAGVIFGWLFKIVWDAIRELKDDMKETNRLIHETYVRKDDYRIEMAKIENMFQRIMDKLDEKADK